jgi:hypothetical protein
VSGALLLLLTTKQLRSIVALRAAERTSGVQKCYWCPTGSVALTSGGLTGQTGSSTCSAW